MHSNNLFTSLPKSFWAEIRLISQLCGYAERGSDQIKVPSLTEVVKRYEDVELRTNHLVKNDEPTENWKLIFEYFKFRADVLENTVKPNLMNPDEARSEFELLHKKLNWTDPLPMNKQKGEKKQIAYLTAMTQMIIRSNAGDLPCDFDPRSLTSITKDGVPLRTLARRFDGAFPSATNPIAIWEIKEYYYTTTFGSRIADGIYETLLDGMELEELFEHESRKIEHYLIVDSFLTWWTMGKSYLCRMVDMQHMGYVDEVLFGREIFNRLPEIVKSWMTKN